MRSRPVVTGNTPPSLSSSMYEKLKSDIEDDDLLVNQGRHFFDFGRYGINSKRKGYKNIDDNGEYITSTIVGDEARYNLATRVMSNGVEVIVASDKNKSTHKPSVFRILPSNLYKPLTLAPSTLKDQMILVMPSESKNNLTIPINPNQFVTKTCLTTYTYQTTYLQDGTTTVESREKVISNIATEERNYLKISPTASFGVTLSRTPELAVGVFYTTYTYLNTILDGELPIVMSSRHIVTNTITGPDDYISFLQPSEEATPNYETNTYYSKIAMTKTLTDGDIHKVVSTSNVLTQVIVTESLPAKSTSVMTSYMAFDTDDKSANKDKNAQYITYTYYNTIANEDEGSIGQMKKPSAAALHSLKTNGNQATIFTDHAYSTGMTSNSINIFNPGGFEVDNTIHVYATKTYLTTFTYFTTLLKSTENEISSTFINSHTRVIENVITESIPNYMLDTKLIEKFSQELVNPTKKQAIITMATLLSGQTLEITALNMLKPTAVIKTANNVITSSAILQDNLNEFSVAPLDEPLILSSNLSEGVTDLDSDDLDNLPDSEAAESEIEETYADEYNDATKIHNRNATKVNTKTDFPMANLIGSLNFNRLTALGPVFNAMAGLIQNNFGSSKRNVTIVKHVPVSVGNQPYLNISSYNNEPDKDHRSPIYIPVQGIRPERDNSAFHTNSQPSPSTLHISPPEKWIIDEKMNRNNKLEFPLNKPAYEIPLLNGGIPISPGEVITANSDVIVGKPAGTRPRVPFNTKLKDLEITSIKSSNDVTPNIIPLNRYQHNRNGVDKYFDTFIKPPPPLAPPEKFAQNQNKYYGNKHFPHRNNVSHLSRYATIPINYSPTTSGVIETINRAILPPNNEILEIKRIPEVYSTDLPPVEVGFQRHHIKKVISTDKTMLVNIQPSQVANVVIPHGNRNSVLIIESTPELHKNGQYFDEPSPYPNTITGEDVRVNHEVHKPILSNQQINLDSHVLSHNVDIHVPPITFKKENDFPYSTPVRGQIPNSGPIHMAHVNIPSTDHEAEINLTPQHVSLPNSYLQVQSGSNEPLDLHNNIDEHKDQLIVATSNTGPPQKPPFEHYQSNGEAGGQFEHNFPHNQSPYYHNEDASILVQQLPAISNIYEGKKPPSNRLPPKPPSNSFKDHGIDNQRYSSEFDFGNNRKPPEFGNIHIHKGPPNQLKRRPIPSLNAHEKPFVLHHPKISNYKPRPVIPLSPGNYNHSHPFPIGLKPRQPINIPFTRQNTGRPPPSSKRPDFYGLQPDNTRNPFPQKVGNNSSFYYVQDYNYQGAADPNISKGQPTLNGEDVFYNHRDDDYENEEGEVVQESNSLPVIPGQYLSNRPDSSVLSKPSVNILDALTSTTDRQNITLDPSLKLTRTTTLSPTTRLKIPPQYISSPPSSLNNYHKVIPTQLPLSIRPPLRGRPFTPAPGKRPASIPHYKHPERPNIHQGERFKKPPPDIKKGVHGSAENLHAYVQVSLPINPSSENDKEAPNLTQTESPFNPKYTQNPLKNISHLDSGVKLSNDGLDLVTTSTTTKPGGDESTKSKLEMENESGEEIFDFKESMNPHNLGVVNNVNEDLPNKVMSTTFKTTEHSMENQQNQNVLKSSTNSDIYKNVINKDSSTIYSFGSEAPVNMKPPPLPPTSKTEEVMGLSPPPPPTSMSPPPISSVSPSSNSPSSTPTQVLSPPAKGTSPSNPSIPIGYNTITFSSDNNLSAIELPSLTNRKPSQNVPFTTTNQSNIHSDDSQESTTKKSPSHKVDTEVKYSKTSEMINSGSKQSISTPKYRSTTSKTTHDVTTSTFGMILKPEISIVPVDDMLGMASGNSRLRPTTRKPSTVKGDKDTDTKLKNTKFTITPIRTTNITPTPSVKDTTSTTISKGNSGHGVSSSSKNHHMFNSKQRIPDEILIVGSENEPFSEDDYTLRVSSDGRKNTAPLINITTKTRLVNKVVLPTKYITNTKTLTVTTTKTTVVKSQGTPSVQTLTLTKIRISTLVDTVTETETQTHTLLQPTKVTISSPPQIRTTVTTIYTLPEHQNYPEYSNKNVNINGNNDETVLFVEDSEGNLDELIINYDDYNEKNLTVEHKTATPTAISSSMNHSSTVAVHKFKEVIENRTTKGPSVPIENESIFVVMSDQKNSPGIININASMMETPAIESIDPDYEAIPFDLPNRDEDHENRENHVLLGGILIATQPKSSSNFDRSSKRSECKPDCRASRNELCQRLEGIMRCVCRPGFARMFPDRPCKPTYTYSLSLPLHRYGKEILVYDGRLSDSTSEEFYNLAGITYEALDRMVMQSDFRDVYHGVHVTGYEKGYNDNGIVGHFYLQLSDNSDENRLVDVFKKYLRHTNYSVGGTDLFTSKFGIDKLRARDFDECLDPQFHDCSDNSQCFNLHGTYTCSCKEGYVDLSENPVYPGRKCSADLIGCEKCYYHGTCYTPDDNEQPICECFHWYTGASCQVNLKILLIALIVIGVSLLILLLFCILVTCSKRGKTRRMQSLMAGINILPPKNTRSMGSNLKTEKRAMIKDSSSEASHNSDTLPYVSKKENKKLSIASVQSQTHTNTNNNQRNVHALSTQAEVERRCNLLDQNDRSLTVMIPRAKYHPIPHQSPSQLNLDINSSGGEGRAPVNRGAISTNITESKILSYLDAGSSAIPTKKISVASSKHGAVHSTTPGALVSAGFEVSATVGQDTSSGDEKNLTQKSPKGGTNQSQYSGYKKSENTDGFIDPMDNWLDTMQQNELTVSEARSYDETTIQPPTKSLRSVYEKQPSQLNNDEANTMAERDVGSTFLLPHTHLYKPDRGSDISGFDSF